jgi:hypothetical protein
MKTRYREPGAERIAFGELSDSILEGVAGGCPEKNDVGVSSKKKGKIDMDELLDEFQNGDISFKEFKAGYLQWRKDKGL